MRIIDPSAFKIMAWKNGGGETAEIAIAPPDATANAFDWRLSTARVAQAGPFSTFEGIDRSLVVLSGQGLKLVAGDDANRLETILRADSEPFAFAGDTPVFAEVVDGGTVTDFNVMTRRSRYTHRLERVSSTATAHLTGEIVFIYCIDGIVSCCNVNAPDVFLALSPGQILIADDAVAGDSHRVTLQYSSVDGKPFQALTIGIEAGTAVNG